MEVNNHLYCPAVLTSKETVSGYSIKGLVGPKTGVNVVVEGTSPAPARNQTPV
jgi:hypothetical protein